MRQRCVRRDRERDLSDALRGGGEVRRPGQAARVLIAAARAPRAEAEREHRAADAAIIAEIRAALR